MIRTKNSGTSPEGKRKDIASRFASLPNMQASEVGNPSFTSRVKNLVQGQLDVRVEPIYDWWQVAINTALRVETLFSIPQGSPYTPAGGTVITKTLFHTTQVQNGVMAAPSKMLVKAISVLPYPNITPVDMNAALTYYLLSFNTLLKQFWQGSPLVLPAGGGPHYSGVAALSAATSAICGTNGWPDASNIAVITDDTPNIPGYQPPPPITGVLLETSQPFTVVVDPTQTGSATYVTSNNTNASLTSAGWTAWVYLHGLTLVAVV
jgi:hypothetical protein